MMRYKGSFRLSELRTWQRVYYKSIKLLRLMINKPIQNMIFIPVKVNKYIVNHTSSPPLLLEELQKETYEKLQFSGMLSGRVVGKLLQLLIDIKGAKKVIDIGTFTGYSALMMAEGLPDKGELITCEISEEYANIAESYFNRSPHRDKISLKLGPALETLRQLPDDSADFVFIDGDKASYSHYYDESIRILKQGGLIVADNTLWHGHVLSPKDKESRALAAFNKKVREDKRVEKVLLTVGDGLYVIRKM